MTHRRPIARPVARRLAVLLPVLLVALAARRPPEPVPVAPSLTASAEATPQGVKLVLEGQEWPAGGTVAFTLRGRPDAAEVFDLGTVRIGRDGHLRATKRTPCTTRDPQRATGRVRITARDTAANVSAEAELPAAVWVCEADVRR